MAALPKRGGGVSKDEFPEPTARIKEILQHFHTYRDDGGSGPRFVRVRDDKFIFRGVEYEICTIHHPEYYAQATLRYQIRRRGRDYWMCASLVIAMLAWQQKYPTEFAALYEELMARPRETERYGQLPAAVPKEPRFTQSEEELAEIDKMLEGGE